MLQEVNIYKMLVNGDQWGTWKGYQLPISNQYTCIWTPRGTARYWKSGTFLSKNHSLTYFWPHTWYVIQISYYDNGSFAEGYCDIVLPKQLYSITSPELSYTDLYVDVVIREDHSVYTKDHEVFDRAAQHYQLVQESRQQAFAVLDWVEQHAKHWTGPFEIMPQQLPRTDLESLSTAEILEIMDGRS